MRQIHGHTGQRALALVRGPQLHLSQPRPFLFDLGEVPQKRRAGDMSPCRSVRPATGVDWPQPPSSGLISQGEHWEPCPVAATSSQGLAEGDMLRDLVLEEQTALAATLFSAEAWRALGPKARGQLLSAALSPDTLRRCARRWHVEATCVLEYVTGLKQADNVTPRDALGRALRRGLIAFSGGFDPDVPPEWREELQRLNRLPLSLGQDLLDRVAPSYVEEYRLTRLENDEDALAMVSANPLVETKEHFLRRADDHYQARGLRLKRVARVGGFTATPPP